MPYAKKTGVSNKDVVPLNKVLVKGAGRTVAEQFLVQLPL